MGQSEKGAADKRSFELAPNLEVGGCFLTESLRQYIETVPYVFYIPITCMID